jgi:hypothetical protein
MPDGVTVARSVTSGVISQSVRRQGKKKSHYRGRTGFRTKDNDLSAPDQAACDWLTQVAYISAYCPPWATNSS